VARPGIVEGIAVVGLTGSQYGTWQFSLNDGRTWGAFGEAYHGRARLLRDIDRVRFVPRTRGPGRATLTFRVWNRTQGRAGDTTNLAGAKATGGVTPFGAAAETIEWCS
jgi:hypothetical protein